MASERDLELLDDYLSNKLNAQDKLNFEQALEKDAALRKEFLVQQRVVEGLRKARATELKQLLNNVPLSSIPKQGPSVLAKVCAFVVAIGLAGTGFYLYFNRDEKVEMPAVTAQEEVLGKEESTKETFAQDQPQAEPKKSDAEVKSESSNKQQPAAQDSQDAASPESTDEKAVAPGARDVFDPSEETKNVDPSVVTENGKRREGVTPSIVVETKANSKYDFHYQFKDNKLYLYGIFEKNLYEIMEFFSDNKRTMFLYYKDSYYLLNEENDNVRPLSPITDEALLKKLKDYRAGR